jgi:hypothetical protein
MNLLRVGTKVINLDRVNGILDHHAPTGADGSDGEPVLRILFDHGQVDLVGAEAQALRRWYRHTSHTLAPQKGEDGEELVSPEDQVIKACEALVELIDRVRPRDSVMRRLARRVQGLVDHYLTGELRPASASEFARSFEEARSRE